MRRALAFAALCVSALLAAAQQPATLLVDIDHRPATSLNGPWHYIVDPYRNGWGSDPDKPNLHGYAANLHYTPGGPLLEYDFAKSPQLQVPGDWNTQQPTLFYYEGLLWYQRDFTWHPRPQTHAFLHIGAANYAAHIFVNDVHICDHEGGFTPFDCEITSAVREGSNFVVIAVDNQRTVDRVPTLKSDWWNYGGLHREVSIVEVPESFIDDYSLQLQKDNRIAGRVHVVNAAAGAKVSLNLPGLNIQQSAPVDAQGNAQFSFEAKNLTRWSPEQPKLYDITLRSGDDTLKDEIGFRTIEVQGDQILLNGQPIFLRGVCVHAEAPYRSGRAWSEKDAETLLGWAKEMHANYVRLTHYPHDEHMTRLADKMGILVWSEIPVYWSINWSNPHTLEVARQQLHEMIRRDNNKASVILWSMSNETPESPARDIFLKALITQARQEDPTRLITSAFVTRFHDKTAVLDDPIGADLDVLGYNEYIGWYQGKPETAPEYKWENPFHKPVIMSEFGGGAKAGLHGPIDQRFTEEYEAEIYRNQFLMFKNIPFLRGVSPWVLMDFRSPVRLLPEIQDGYNRKGLISDQGEKKKAFYVVQENYAHPQ